MRAPGFWAGRGWQARVLLPLAAVFLAVTALRRLLYRRAILKAHRVGVPVVVVGNIDAGGSGKTPLVIALVVALRARGFKPGVVSRGYGGTLRGVAVLDETHRANEVGDEPLLIQRKTGVPVAVGRRRADAARTLLDRHPEIDVILSDDGLQHYALARTLEIGVLDGARGLGNGWLLPAGPLREPAQRLAEVDALVVSGDARFTGSEGEARFTGSEGEARFTGPAGVPAWRVQRRLGMAWRINQPALRLALAELPPITWLASCGIANPDGFFRGLRAAGLAIEPRAFGDHHVYGMIDLPGGGPVLMTEKDAVKCADFAGNRWWAVELVAEPEPGLIDWLDARLRDARRSG